MNTIEQDGRTHEIIIVRRPRHDEDEAHHGGVWKIAFADFMTALMCFFLVMWLINAANEETRAALASYFNPVKLIDRNASRKGIDEMGGPQSVESAPENQEDTKDTENPNKPTMDVPKPADAPSKDDSSSNERSDEHLFSDPYAVLAEIAGETGKLQNPSSKGDGGAQAAGPASGASGGESYRDPFAPDFWSQQVDVPDAQATTLESGEDAEALAQTESEPSASAEEVAAETPPAEDAAPQDQPASPPAEAVAAEAEATVAAEPAPAEPPTPVEVAAAPEPEPEPAEPSDETDPTAEAEKAAEAIREELAEVVGEDDALADGISVTATEDGVMISITDQIDFGMFEIGSAVPRRELVLAMEKIARILSEREGEVSIKGHTDGRPFKSETYDNWRLSTARAHSAYFMLVRGGLAEQRIMEVAGLADRKLKTADDPLADVNRRIEILLESGG